MAESFFATIKRELISTRPWRGVVELRRAVFNYIEGWYNTRRLHSSSSYLSPAQWEALHRDTLAQQRGRVRTGLVPSVRRHAKTEN